MTIADDKSTARAAAVLRRDAAHARLGAAAPQLVVRNFRAMLPDLAALPALGTSGVISGYWPGRSELDIRPLMKSLYDMGHPIGLPVVLGRGKPLLFRRWQPGATLEAKSFGLQEPPASSPEVAPDILLVPFLAIDREGYRIGYGAGYYDMTLAVLRERGRVLAIGVGYADQQVERLPRESFDQRLDLALTEEGVVTFTHAANDNAGSDAR
jgi:5-formyltetrahydrofolate cyclo-ligase